MAAGRARHRSTPRVALALGRPADGRGADDADRTIARKHGLANACRLIFNTNEFVFVD